MALHNYLKFVLCFLLLNIFACNETQREQENTEIKNLPPLPHEPFNLIELPLAHAELQPKTSDQLMQLQHKLWDHQVPLNPATFKSVPEDSVTDNQLNESQWLQFKAKLPPEQSAIFEKLMQARDYITYKELSLGLAAVITKFSDLVQGDYSIGFNLRKSSQWIASLAIPYVKELPQEAFWPPVDTFMNPGLRHSGLKAINDVLTKHYVIFDDASYSGSQLAMILMGILDKSRDSRITIFLLFASDYALAKIRDRIEMFNKNNNIVTVVTTTRRLKPLSEAITIDEFKNAKIQDMETAEKYKQVMLSYPAWKVPDGVSFPDCLIVAAQGKNNGILNNRIKGFGLLTGYTAETIVTCGSEDNDHGPVYCFLPQIIAPYKKYKKYDRDTL